MCRRQELSRQEPPRGVSIPVMLLRVCRCRFGSERLEFLSPPLRMKLTSGWVVCSRLVTVRVLRVPRNLLGLRPLGSMMYASVVVASLIQCMVVLVVRRFVVLLLNTYMTAPVKCERAPIRLSDSVAFSVVMAPAKLVLRTETMLTHFLDMTVHFPVVTSLPVQLNVNRRPSPRNMSALCAPRHPGPVLFTMCLLKLT